MAGKLDIPTTVAELCLAFPDVEAKMAHGNHVWTVGGKQFAVFSLNHHGDGHVGLLLRAPPGEQQRLVKQHPETYYVPPYYGKSGWVGIELNGDVDWNDVVSATSDAWRHVAPAKLSAHLGKLPRIARPRKMKPEEIDPFQGRQGKRLLLELREICLALPETTEDTQFGAPNFRVGKKSYATLHHYEGRFGLQAWVGEDRQAMLTFDERYRIPPYIGHNGWIELDLEQNPSAAEMEALVLESYRHFATKRALKALASH